MVRIMWWLCLAACAGAAMASAPLVGFTHAAWNARWPPVVIVIPTGPWDATASVLPATVQGCVMGSRNVLAELPRLEQISVLGFEVETTVAFGLLCDLPEVGTTVNVSTAPGAVPLMGGETSPAAAAALPYNATFDPHVWPWCGLAGVRGARLGSAPACAPVVVPGVVPGVTSNGTAGVPVPSPPPVSGSGSHVVALGLSRAHLSARQWIPGATGSDVAAAPPGGVVVVATTGAPSGNRTAWTAFAGEGCAPWVATLHMVPLPGAGGPWVGLCSVPAGNQALTLGAAPGAASVPNTGGGTLVSHSVVATLVAAQPTQDGIKRGAPDVGTFTAPAWGPEVSSRASALPPGHDPQWPWPQARTAAFTAPLGLEGLLVDATGRIPLGKVTVWTTGGTSGWWHGHPTWLGFGHPIVDTSPGADLAWATYTPPNLGPVNVSVTGCSLSPATTTVIPFRYLRGPGVYVAWCGATGNHTLTLARVGVPEVLTLAWHGTAPGGNTYPDRFLALTSDITAAADTNSSVRWGALFTPITPSPSRTPSRTPTRTPTGTSSPSRALDASSNSDTASVSGSASTTASPSPSPESASGSPSISNSASVTPSVSASTSSSASVSPSFVPTVVVAVGFGGLSVAPLPGGTVVVTVGPLPGGLVVSLASLGIQITGCVPGWEPAQEFVPAVNITCVVASGAPVEVTVPALVATYGPGGVFWGAAVTARLPVRPVPVLSTAGGPAPGIHNGSALTVVLAVAWPTGNNCPDLDSGWLLGATLTGGATWDAASATASSDAPPCGNWELAARVVPGSGGFAVNLPDTPWTDVYGDSAPIPGAVLLVQVAAGSRSPSRSLSGSRSPSGSATRPPSPSVTPTGTVSVSRTVSVTASVSGSRSVSRSFGASPEASTSGSRTGSRSGSRTTSSAAQAADSTSSDMPVETIVGVVAGVAALAAAVAVFVHFRTKPVSTPVFGSGARP